ncbi:hypothetical protein AB0I77_29565 [Streptomyces sp. NPDC050619]|uniref:hypothetical protein n=1 Tax=Streptomyces sp. NPDC050619 TaxID=3157214 RepID=UPI00342EC58F
MTDPTSAGGEDSTSRPIEPSDLDVAISVARQLLESRSVLSLRESLRLLLRALDAEPDTEKGPELVPTPGGEPMTAKTTPPTEARELRDLLAAIREALTLPFDTADYDRRLIARAGWARAVVDAVLDNPGEDIGWNADFLHSKLTAEQADAEARASKRGEGQ